MTHHQYRAALAALDLTQVGAAALFGISDRMSRYYAQGRFPVPRAIEIALNLMLKYNIKPDEV